MVPRMYEVRNDPQGQSQNHIASEHLQALSTPNIKGCLTNLMMLAPQAVKAGVSNSAPYWAECI